MTRSLRRGVLMQGRAVWREQRKEQSGPSGGDERREALREGRVHTGTVRWKRGTVFP